ncbi:hypothetical protein NL429_29380, partial [Klebsiella pneumoniae]|nr:hypothetical protein [Klebsiella pneumoniae]
HFLPFCFFDLKSPHLSTSFIQSVISAERDQIGISLIFCLHIFNTKYTLRLIWYDQITLRIQETDMLYKGDTLYLDWLEDGIAEL